MTAVLDRAPVLPIPAAAGAFPRDAAFDTVREARLDRHTAAPLADARAFAVACAWDWHLSESDRTTLVLVVDELVGNALKHAVWPTELQVLPLRLTRLGRQVVVEVRDFDLRLPRWPGSQVWDLSVIDGPAGPDDAELVRGHGLGIVSALADDLCALPEPGGKVVRASVPLRGVQ
ncbi:ATP-binding protein [Catenulispora sp. NF23]|uniref:ATP-binding protein n=1 Tax=Catenulispora pinistramenti TaxID=2705254 RepID=UPI001BADFF71|nr:ATP-binding protein [Catenulispora pinistramenti]MBS2538918.1 ATP-binding protein [Catenulispora pinistramenti]